MSIHGIGGGTGNPALTPPVRDRASIDESAKKAIRPSEDSTSPVTAARRATERVPTEAPPGTDPALWSVLTAEERSFFERAQPVGPLTYGPANRGSVSPSAVLGGRLDLRV